MSKVPVMEIFGPTIQGEGMVIGQKTMFVRTAGCDYSCSWCDSAFTWDGSGKELIKQMDAEEIWQELKALGGDGFSFVTISGGNPALLKNLQYLIDLLKDNNIKIALETQGSKWQDWFLEIDELTISPKPPSSGMVTDFYALDMIITKLKEAVPAQSVSLKVVVFDDHDYEYAKKVHKRYQEVPFFLQVGNDDNQTTDNQHLVSQLLQRYEWLINKSMLDDEVRDVKVLPQLHTYIWGNKRGV
ncbi:7-carboxy-7-deazaguanine synthase QueE [Cytobacillus dafuensis]|uniref:7-carboxy-7-deazaguanine synthase n=1 Tax=Cytobacillus dafuensis TaxID=1742359 RepID=A0A5B8Z4P4_CYTDA|nr:7-carboxy-7-deazaguanine synthase QueE [Cytobacillus dafuensis]QED48070.1 7-carboxy-7-deazaguanine synthase QueE [Cytobacillus dafuensis]